MGNDEELRLTRKMSREESKPATLDDILKVLKEVKQGMSEMKDEQKNMLKEIKELKKSQTFISKQYDDMLVSNQRIEEENKEIKKVVTEVQAERRKIEERLRNVEQYTRKNKVEICGIPKIENEDLEDAVTQVAQKLSVNLVKNDIEVAHRLHAEEGKTPNLIVSFANRKKRDEMYTNRYKAQISSKEIVPCRSAQRIYVNESLSPYYKHLLYECKKEAKAKSYKYCWFLKNKVLLRKSDGANVIAIHNVEQLGKIV